MKNFKQEIANKISEAIEIDKEEIYEYIEIPKDSKIGDYAFPCFKLAKELKKSPQIIAQDIKEKINTTGTDIEKIEILGGYLNFTISKIEIIQEVLKEIELKKDEYGKSDIGKNKTIIVEYSSPNIAKPFHIGHLRTTLIGKALYHIY